MNPFFFGDPTAPLYGVFHEPDHGRLEDTAVLLCGPIGHEYMRTNRAFRLLSERLVSKGIASLRFDYRGIGDSAGAADEARPEHWLEDIAVAGEELLDMSGAESLAVVGLRMGGILAAQAFESDPSIQTLILWDPIPSGGIFLDQILALEKTRRQRCSDWAGKQDDPPENGPWTILGYPFTVDQREAIRKLGMPELDRLKARQIRILASDAEMLASLRKAFGEAPDPPVRMEHIPDGGNWQLFEKSGGALLVNPILQKIVEIVTKG